MLVSPGNTRLFGQTSVRRIRYEQRPPRLCSRSRAGCLRHSGDARNAASALCVTPRASRRVTPRIQRRSRRPGRCGTAARARCRRRCETTSVPRQVHLLRCAHPPLALQRPPRLAAPRRPRGARRRRRRRAAWSSPRAHTPYLRQAQREAATRAAGEAQRAAAWAARLALPASRAARGTRQRAHAAASSAPRACQRQWRTKKPKTPPRVARAGRSAAEATQRAPPPWRQCEGRAARYAPR